jgi:hypothetical protein
MNRFLDRIARLYAPVGQRGLLMDGQYRFAPEPPQGKGAAGPRNDTATPARRDSPWLPGRYLHANDHH